jgi:hypothetical protein
LPILEFLHDRKIRGLGWAVWYRGFENSIPIPEGTPEKIIIKKMKQMIRKGLVAGCGCGCRGDYEISEDGIKKLFELSDAFYNIS